MSNRGDLLALATYPERAAATRFRLSQVVPYLEADGWRVHFEPFVEDKFFRDFYSPGRRLHKGAYLLKRTLRQLAMAIAAGSYSGVFIQKAAALLGPPYTEFILYAIKRVPVVFDFDDAIWHLHPSQSRHPVVARLLKNPEKCWYAMRRASLVIAGSEYLGQRARKVNQRVEVVPTTVSATEWCPLPGRLGGEFLSSTPRIGWVGSHTTAHQLRLVEPALHRLRSEGFRFDFRIVGADARLELSSVEATLSPWTLEHEIEDFQRIDIGLAPMHSQPIYQGKCGFKQLQYMAVGVPFVSSWVGGAKDFLIDGQNALVARSPEDWYRHVRALLVSQDLRAKLSIEGRRLVEAKYCIEIQGPRLVRCLENAIARSQRTSLGGMRQT